MSYAQTYDVEETPVFNKKRAEDVLRSVLSFPEEHLQDQWLEVKDFSQTSEIESSPEEDEDGNSVETRTVTVNSMLEGSCGTTACIAGWAVLHAGWKFNTTLKISPDGWESISYESISPTGDREELASVPELERQGKRALGLTDDQVETLFFTMDEKLATIRLYSLIKGWNDDLFSIASNLNIDVDQDEDGYFDEDGVMDQIIAEIKDEYPPFSYTEIVSFQSPAETAPVS